jgi:cathepsin D
VLDTGSADLWVADTSCTDCQGDALFDPSASTSYQASTVGTTIRYGSGSVSGQLAQDVVSMGGFTISNQVFCTCFPSFPLVGRIPSRLLPVAADSLTTRLLNGPVAGIFGLAFQAIAATRALPFWEALTNGGELTSPEMSFYLTRFRGVRSVSEEEPGGTFTLGGTNSSLYTGDIEYLDVVEETYWLLNLAGE